MTRTDPTGRRGLLGVAGAASLGWLSGLAGCAGPDRDGSVLLTPREIARLLARRFPIEQRVLEIFEVTIGVPQLHLLAERNRLAARTEVKARERLGGGRFGGELEFDSGLRWEPRDDSLRLEQVRVQDLALAAGSAMGPRGPARQALERIGAAVAERVLEDMSLYTLPPERAERLRRAGSQPSAVTITGEGVRITLGGVRT